MSRQQPREAWILTGDPYSLFTPIAGLPHGVRLAGELALAGITHITIVWTSALPMPDIAPLVSDPRVRARIAIHREPPGGAANDAIVIVRAGYAWHRDTAKAAIAAWCSSRAQLAKVDGDDDSAVVVVARRHARAVAELADIAIAPAPYLGFVMPIDRRNLRAVERRLVWSLRKPADGIAAKLLNRRLSLPLTYLLMRTRVLPNHVTLCALACALAGAFVIARGGYAAGVAGMLLVELGSIIDGVDGELARLRLQFSRRGQWLDTLVDDIANATYATGVMINLQAAGIAWAQPVWLAGVTAFATTQAVQYWLIARVYDSGDLAAIPWAFQSSEFLSRRPRGALARIKATLPKLLKRDFVVTLFVVLAACDLLAGVLAVFAAGAIGFCCVFFVQLARNLDALRVQRA